MKKLKTNNQLSLLKRKGFVSLLEVMIAMTLTVLVLTTLTYFYRQVIVIGSDLDKVQKESFEKRYVENILSDVLPKATSEKDPKNDFVFFTAPEEIGLTKSPSLIFTFDNGIDIDKVFSNNVIGRLFVDPSGRLILAYWPSPKRWDGNPSPPMKKEILLEGVDSLGFEFFIAPKKDSEPKKETATKDEKKSTDKPEAEKDVDPEPQGDWRKDNWPADYKQLPAMIKLNLTLNSKEKLTFVYPFPNTKRPITYDQ